MDKLVLIDGNSIINRAFYGIMNSNMLRTEDGIYTNAIYGFLAIMFKILEDIDPQYIAVAFDLKAPTHRHKMYDQYKATRKGMPDELASQMPILKDILRAMNIKIIEQEGYEADDILGTLAKWGEGQGLAVTILTGDRDSFQLASENITIRIPRTKMGKTETEDFNKDKIIETYGVEPIKLIEVKGLMGDTSDNIPGVYGIGEKTAINLIKEYGTIEELYKRLDNNTDTIKGKARQNLIDNKEMAFLSRTLGTIDINAPIEKDLESIKNAEWDNDKVLEIFKKLRFNRFIERFNLKSEDTNSSVNNELEEFKYEEISDDKLNELIEELKKSKKMYYYISKEPVNNENLIINKQISGIAIYSSKNDEVYYIKDIKKILELFENSEIGKYGYKQKEDYVLLKQLGIKPNSFVFDIEIAGYLLNSTTNKYNINYLSLEYLNFDIDEYLNKFNIEENKQQMQINMFDSMAEKTKEINELDCIYANLVYKLSSAMEKEMEKVNMLELFNTIEMPLVEILSEMQYEGMTINREELIAFGNELQNNINELTKQIHELCGEEFNINSTKQLGEVLFDKMKLTAVKKTKTGYSTDVDVLEKIKHEHPVIEKILEYRQITKLYTTYVEGLSQYINKKTGKIHSYFHQTVTATGRISSSEPNVQNIPTRIELGKRLRKVFKPLNGHIFIDADYSQIELRVMAHISQDKGMLDAFNKDEDIHKQAASKIFNIPLDDVTKEQRGKAKAVNFGIIYGISEFGLAEQIGVSRKESKKYIEDYLNKYSGIKKFMTDIVEEAKEKGFVETIYHRRRYVPEIKSNNYMVKQFGARVAMNTPIQGTAADIMKIAMINVYNELNKNNLKSKLILQVHDELLIDTDIEEKEIVKNILKNCMESAIKLKVPLKAELSEGYNWYEVK